MKRIPKNKYQEEADYTGDFGVDPSSFHYEKLGDFGKNVVDK
jgi:hypothetical protein